MNPSYKTTYDPKVINDTDYAAAAERVSQKIYDDKLSAYLSDPLNSNNRIFEKVDPVSGIKFAVYFDKDIKGIVNAGQPFIGNAHIIP